MLSFRVISACTPSITKTTKDGVCNKDYQFEDYPTKFRIRTTHISLFLRVFFFHYNCFLTNRVKQSVLAIMHAASSINFASHGAGLRKDTGY